MSMARLVLTQPGEDVVVGGEVTVVGTTSGGEVITVLLGNIVLDASFNAGGDTVELPGAASAFTVRLVGSTAVLTSAKGTVTIPVGTAGLQVAFEDVSRTLRFDTASSSVKLGDQVLTSSDTGVMPSGVSAQSVGTDSANVINGTAAADSIDGLAGNDTINGLGGDDFIRGGDGDDTIDGGAGDDTIDGGAGNDRIFDNQGDYAEIEGSAGNDHISVNNLALTSAKIAGGDGDDLIDLTIGKIGFGMVDAGSGNDRIVVNSQGMETSLLLGDGRDEVVLPAGSLSDNGVGFTIIRDFEVGANGDKVTFGEALNSYLQNYTAGSNPFASGHLKLTDFYGNAYLQVDRDGSAGSAAPQDLINFAGVNLDTLTAENMSGFDPKAASATQSSFRLAAIVEPEPASQPEAAPAEQPTFEVNEVPSLQSLGLTVYHGSHYYLP